MKIMLKAMLVASFCLIGCATLGTLGIPRPPIELPIAFDKAGTVVSTELYIPKDRRFYCCLEFKFNPKDNTDRERVWKYLGNGVRDVHVGNFDQTGIIIPLKITVSRIEPSGEKIISEAIYSTMGNHGWGGNYLIRDIGYINLPQGLCRVRVQCLKDIPELANRTIMFRVLLRSRGKA